MGNYYLYRLGQYLGRILPLAFSRWVVMRLCDMHYCFSSNDRRAVEENLRHVMQVEAVPQTAVRAVFRNFGQYLLEFFTMAKWLNAPFIQSHVRITNIGYLNETLQKGKGGIIVSAHLGNWEMGGALLPMLGYPLSVIALAHKDPRVNALFNAQRELFGAKVIQTDVAVRRVLEDLQENRLVAILADRDFGNHGYAMALFGQKAMVPKGAAFFSMKTGAPIIPMFILRRGLDHFEIIIHPPLDPPYLPDGKITDEEAEVLVRAYLGIIEDEIRKQPSQWLLFREISEA